MRLRDLDARFVGECEPGARAFRVLDGIAGAQGVEFQCPKCAEGLPPAEDGGVQGAHYVLVWFANPFGAPPAPADAKPRARWTATGSSIDDLTLMPSVNLDTPGDDGVVRGCRWHGWVQNGAAA